MATVSGSLKFDRERTALYTPDLQGIANVPIVLQNVKTNEMLSVYTDANGDYVFINVPDGHYRIAESYGMPAAASPGNFLRTAVGNTVTAAVPPVHFVSNPPKGADSLVNITSNTLFVTIAGMDVANQNFVFGAADSIPIQPLADPVIAVVTIFKYADKSLLKTGDTIQYTIHIENTGANGPIVVMPDATNIIIVDQLPAPLSNPEYSVDNGQTWQAWSGSHTYSILQYMESADLLIRATFTGSPDTLITNATSLTYDSAPIPVSHALITYIDHSADLSIEKTSDLTSLERNDVITYTMVINNAGLETAQNVIVSDTLPSALINGQYSEDNGQIWQNWSGTYTMSTLAVGTTVTLLVRGTFNGSPDNTISNTATVTSDKTDNNLTNNSSTVTTTVIHSADMAILKQGDKQSLKTGEVLTYTLQVTNNGPDAAQNVIVSDTVSSLLSTVEYSADNGQTWQSFGGNYTIGTMANGESVTLLVRGTLISSSENLLSNTATVSADTPDPDVSENTSTVETTIVHVADLSITKQSDKQSLKTNEVITYTLQVTNNGPDAAENVEVSDTMPSALSTVEYSADNGQTWQSFSGTYVIGTMVSNSSVTLQIRGTLGQTRDSSLSNTATVTSITLDPNENNNSSSVTTPIIHQADVAVIKRGDKQEIQTGEVMTYTLEVTNQGPDIAENVIVRDPLPTALINSEYSADSGQTWQTWSGVYTIGELASNSQVSLQIRGTLYSSPDTVLTNVASVESDTTDPFESNNSTVTTPITHIANLSISKQGDKQSVKTGEVLTYTVKVTNQGPDLAENVIVRDTLPAALTNVEYSADNGQNWLSFSGIHNIGALASGSESTLLIRGLLANTPENQLTNTVTVESDTLAPDESTNSSTVTTQIIHTADLAILMQGDKENLKTGDLLTYTLTVDNLGPNTAENVIVSHTLIPSQEDDESDTETFLANRVSPLAAQVYALTGVEFSLDNGMTWQVFGGSHTIGTMINGASFSFLIRGVFNGSTDTLVSHTATVVSTTPELNTINNSSTVSTPIIRIADLTIHKESNRQSIKTGEVITYTIQVTNQGPDVAENVIVRDTLPSSLVNGEYSTNNGLTWLSFGGIYTINALTSGSTVSLLIRGTFNDSTDSMLSNTAVVESDALDPDITDNSSTVNTPITRLADLAIHMQGDKQSLTTGDILVYTLQVTNHGPDTADNVIVSDGLPSSLLNGEYSLNNGLTWQHWTGTHAMGNLANGAALSLLIRGTFNSSTDSFISNTAEVSSVTPDPNESNNSSTVNTPVAPPMAHPCILSIHKLADKQNVKIGDILTYTLQITNQGTNTAENVVVRDTLPSSLMNGEYSLDNGLTWQHWNGTYTIGTLAGGASASLQIRAALSSTVEQSISNIASAESKMPNQNIKYDSNTVTTSIIRESDLVITKSCDRQSIMKGDLLTYTLKVLNKGPDTAENVVVADALPNYLTNGQYSLDNGSTWHFWNSSYTIGTVKNGETISLLIRARFDGIDDDTVSNTAIVRSSTSDPDMSNSKSTVTTKVKTEDKKEAMISFSKSVCPICVRRNSNLMYTIIITNEGTEAVHDVLLIDTLPEEIQHEFFSVDDGKTWDWWNGTLNIQTLNVGSCIELLILGRVNRCACGCINNTAKLCYRTSKTSLQNQHASASVQVIE